MEQESEVYVHFSYKEQRVSNFSSNPVYNIGIKGC